MISVLQGFLMSDGPPTEDRPVSTFLDYVALACIFGFVEQLMARRYWTSGAALVAAVISHIVGIKWPKIKLRTWPRFAATLEKIAGSRRYYRWVIGVVIVALLVSITIGAYHHHYRRTLSVRPSQSKQPQPSPSPPLPMASAVPKQSPPTKPKAKPAERAHGAPPSKPQTQKPSDQPSSIPPPVLDVRVASQQIIPSTKPDAPYALELIVQTNIGLKPVTMHVVCDGPIDSLEFQPESVTGLLEEGGGLVKGHPNVWGLTMGQPGFTPEDPLVIHIYSKQLIHFLRLEVGPFQFMH